MENTIGYKIPPEGFRTIVVMCMTGEVGEHYTEIRKDSLLELADQVARRCMALCGERDVEMNDDIYAEVVSELAPQMADEM